eukprot:3084210-Lingulodinium_polyedra.AAC.1
MPPVEPTEDHEQMPAASVAATEKRERTASAETGIWRARCELWLHGQEQFENHLQGNKRRATSF